MLPFFQQCESVANWIILLKLICRSSDGNHLVWTVKLNTACWLTRCSVLPHACSIRWQAGEPGNLAGVRKGWWLWHGLYGVSRRKQERALAMTHADRSAEQAQTGQTQRKLRRNRRIAAAPTESGPRKAAGWAWQCRATHCRWTAVACMSSRECCPGVLEARCTRRD